MILVTGGLGFLGRHILTSLLVAGDRHIRCVVRHGTDPTALSNLIDRFPGAKIELYPASLDEPAELEAAVRGSSVVYHAAASKSGSYAAMTKDTVVSSENMYRACVECGVDRFVLVSSFSVIDAGSVKSGQTIDESTPLEKRPEVRDPYSFSKQRQESVAWHYAREHGLPLVVVRPGVIFGEQSGPMSPRIGVDLFGIFFHLGRDNQIPLTFVENCADAIVLAGKVPEALGQIIGIVDDDLPTSAEILRRYRQSGAAFRVIPIYKWMLSPLSRANTLISYWSKGQFPVVFKETDISCLWAGHRYSNAKAKTLLGWYPRVSMEDALNQTFSVLKQS